MIFTSFNFLLFFPTVILIYYLIPIKFRWKFILISSLFFYASIKPVYILLLLLISFFTYFFTLLIDSKTYNKKILLITSIITILSPLFFFKYYNSINTFIISILQTSKLKFDLPEINFLLPIGISYYTFMSIGYIIDVYNEEIKAEKKFGLVTLFLSFFPLVLSGPIERAENMFSQFKNKLKFNYKKTVYGFKLILWGYFLKLVLADNLALYLNPIFNEVNLHSGKTILLAVFLFPFQIYGDLGGYSLIAIGTASVMGINVRINFNKPFFSKSMSEFWRRWHMSLISWITDYIYTPISFYLRKFKLTGIIFSLLITFLVAGIWHEASLSFIIWGLIQGSIISFEAISKRKKNQFEKKFNLKNNKFYILFCIILVYILFSISLIFGGAFNSFSESIISINRILSNSDPLYINQRILIKSLLVIILILLTEFRDEYYPNKWLLFENKKGYIRWISYYSIILIILFFGVFNQDDFIYFQF